jgi:hypothetical protein|tara:strand:+ start:55 stop:270 length:216 start_codon:yes stop_codon:yes gene_type:complete
MTADEAVRLNDKPDLELGGVNEPRKTRMKTPAEVSSKFITILDLYLDNDMVSLAKCVGWLDALNWVRGYDD